MFFFINAALVNRREFLQKHSKYKNITEIKILNGRVNTMVNEYANHSVSPSAKNAVLFLTCSDERATAPHRQMRG